MAALRAIIFDVDGTLADTEELHRWAFNKAFAEAGLDWHWSKALYGVLLGVTGGKERIAHFMRDHLHEDPGGLDIPALHKNKTAHYKKAMGQGDLPLRPGVERLIGEARDHNILCAIATTTSPANVAALVEACFEDRIEDIFPVIAAGDMVTHKKPAADVYQLALEQLNLPPAQCIALEDSRNGLLSAKGAGLSCLITENEYTKGQDFSEAAAVLSDLGSLDAPARCYRGPPLPGGHVNMAYLQNLLMASLK